MTDTLLPGMKLGRNFVTGIERHFTSWKSFNDPVSGEFSYRIDTSGYPQTILMDGPDIKFRGGPWNGLKFTGFPNLRPNPIYNYTFVLTQREIYYQYHLISSVLTRVVLYPNGHIERLLWTDSKQEWTLYMAPGFEPRSLGQWRGADSSQGCRRIVPLDCGPGEGFNNSFNLKLPDTQGSWYNQTMTLVECQKMCKSNCSCTAYTNSNVSGA
ncbi:putative non-specific serine/threonine protein kinase [Helianthus anomalus]